MHTGNTRSSLFLIELIIAILFFSLGSAVCVQAFVKAHTISTEASDLSFASSTVSSAASVVKYTDGTLDSLRTYFPLAFQQDDDVEICYDATRAACGPQDASYTLHIRTDAQDGAETASIWMDSRSGQVLYELDLRYPSR